MCKNYRLKLEIIFKERLSFIFQCKVPYLSVKLYFRKGMGMVVISAGMTRVAHVEKKNCVNQEWSLKKPDQVAQLVKESS